MLQRQQIGRRIAALRKNAGFSQTALAEALTISSQAVSKWESGQALPDVEMLLLLSRLFGVTVNEILEGKNLLARLAARPFSWDEVALFVPPEEKAGNVSWAREIVAGGWVLKNWENQKNDPGRFAWIARRINGHGGTILEIGAGPGGGYMPATLLDKPDAEVIVSDLSPTVVQEWKKLFERAFFPPNVHYAALDNCDLPFCDNAIDVISSGGGFGNTEGDKSKALTEIYRVLKPGGLYVSGEGFVTKETLAALPDQAQTALLEQRPDIFEDYYAASVMAGFKTIDTVICGGWSTKGDESQMADLASKLGVEIQFTGYCRFCTK